MSGQLGVDETGAIVTQANSEGKVLSLILGAVQNSSGGGGGGGSSAYILKSANYAVQANDPPILADTSGGAFTITLPASPTVGQFVVIADAQSTWGTNNLTVARNGQLIESTAANLTADVSGVQLTLVFAGGTRGWAVQYQMAQATASGGIQWTVKTGSFTGVSGSGYQIDTTGGAVTCTMPASAAVGDQLFFGDATLNWSSANVTFARNGLKINGATSDFTANVNGASISAIYISAGYGWSMK